MKRFIFFGLLGKCLCAILYLSQLDCFDFVGYRVSCLLAILCLGQPDCEFICLIDLSRDAMNLPLLLIREDHKTSSSSLAYSCFTVLKV